MTWSINVLLLILRRKITDWFTKAYDTAYLLPSSWGEDGINLDVDISEEILCLEKLQKLLSMHNKAQHHCYKKLN
jgi:hypothetical protein